MKKLARTLLPTRLRLGMPRPLATQDDPFCPDFNARACDLHLGDLRRAHGAQGRWPEHDGIAVGDADRTAPLPVAVSSFASSFGALCESDA